MVKKTVLNELHHRLNGKMVDFAGWEMPLHYGSQIKEHQYVRQIAGMFDVSHMTVIDLSGAEVCEFLSYLLANDINKLVDGKALYTCMLNEQGGVLDDLIVYRLHEGLFRAVLNAATYEKDMAWISSKAEKFSVTVEQHTDKALIAIQGPQARGKVHEILDPESRELVNVLKPFYCVITDSLFIARTGYTGEDGYEILLPAIEAPDFWQKLYKIGVKPIGLGARDTLRLEAGMALYGQEMDDSTTPLETGLGWTVSWEPSERDFIGRIVLESKRDDPNLSQQVGLILEDKGVLRSHQKVYADGNIIGEITSGSYSPVIGKSIALARVSSGAGEYCQVDIRGRKLKAKVVSPPFVRNGKICTT